MKRYSQVKKDVWVLDRKLLAHCPDVVWNNVVGVSVALMLTVHPVQGGASHVCTHLHPGLRFSSSSGRKTSRPMFVMRISMCQSTHCGVVEEGVVL